jgi:anti-sigma factor RsiW
VAAATVLPSLPGGLRLEGSDLVPWDGGTAVLALYGDGSAEGRRVVTLFTAEPGSFAVVAPRAASVHGVATVFWQDGHRAYALNGSLPESELLAIARAVAPRPWAGALEHLHLLGGSHG